MAGASTGEAGQTAASSAGRTEEEERRKKVCNMSASLLLSLFRPVVLFKQTNG